MVNPNFTGIRGDAHGVIGKGVKKRRLDVPNIAFLDAGILFDILGYSRLDCLYVSGSLIYYNARKHICRFQFNRRLAVDDFSSAVELVYSIALLLVCLH